MNDESCKIAREKYWSEVDDAERVKRLRREVKHLRREVYTLNRAMRFLQTHSHAPDGSVVISLFMRDEPELTDRYAGTLREPDGDDMYF
jgi:hypothetical protein